MIDVSEASFEREVVRASDQLPILVEFWAPWSASSRTLGPLLERVERDSAGAFGLVRVDVEENSELIKRLGIKSVPFTLLFEKGQPVDGFVGTPTADQIEAFVTRHVSHPVEGIDDRARAALDDGRFHDALDLLRTMLAINPADRQARAHYVRTLIRLRRFDEARTAFDPLRGRAATDYAADVLGCLVSAAELARTHPGDAVLRDAVVRAEAMGAAGRDALLAARYDLGQWLLVEGRAAEAMDEFLVVLGSDKLYRDGAARKMMLAALDLDRDAERVARYRRRLAATLFT